MPSGHHGAASIVSSSATTVKAKKAAPKEEGNGPASSVASSSSSSATAALEDPAAVDEAGLLVDVGNGAGVAEPPASSRGGTNKNKCVMRTLMVTALALVIFAVVFPAVYLTRPAANGNSESSSSSSSTDSSSGNDPSSSTSSSSSVVPSNSTLDHLRLFGADILTGYAKDASGITEMQTDLEYAAWFLVGQVVQRNSAGDGSTGGQPQRPGGGNDGTESSQPVANDGGGSGSGSAASPATGGADSASSGNGFAGGSGGGFGTNNQEVDVEEGDTTVSDGTYVYSANGAHLLVWDALQGTMVAHVQMPDVVSPGSSGTSSGTSPGSAGAGSSSTPADVMPYPYPARPQINTLLHYRGRLLVIVQGNGAGIVAQQGWNESVLYDFLNTQVRVYATATLTSNATTNNYEPLFTANLQGTFQGVRSKQGKVHVLSTSSINTYTDLVMPFEVWNQPDQYGNLTPDQYKVAAAQKAQQEAIPAFVNKMTTQLAMGDAGMPQLIKISLFQNEYSGSPNGAFEAMTFPNGILNSLALVHSFDMMATGSSVVSTTGTRRRRRTQQTVAFTSVGAFLPSYWSQFYGSVTHLIIAGQGNRVDAATGYSVESTNFLSFRIDDNNSAGPTVTAEAAGSVDGYVINNYAMDVKDSYLRVGVSINRGWFFLTEPMPMMEDGDAAANADGGDSGVASDPSTTSTAAEPSATPATTNSTTENYMVILSLPGRANATDAGMMQEVGRLKLGKPDELFMAIRIYDNVAYAVTFERTDPLYVLDLSVPTNPRIVAELSVLGFSSYLHSLNANNTLLLGVGSSADENGTVTGIKLSVYDLSNPAAPAESAQHVILNGATSYTYTAAASDFKSLRVVPADPSDPMNRQLVAIPVETSNWQSGYHFNGYHTFFVNKTHIVKKCEIGYAFNESQPYPLPAEGGGDAPVSSDGGSTTPSDGTTADGSSGTDGSGSSGSSSGSSGGGGGSDSMPSSCYYCGYMAPRAMLFGNDLMTINNRFVRSQDVDTCAPAWSLDVLIQEASPSYYGCCGVYW